MTKPNQGNEFIAAPNPRSANAATADVRPTLMQGKDLAMANQIRFVKIEQADTVNPAAITK